MSQHRLFVLKTGKESKHGWHMPMTLELERMRQEEHQFETGYIAQSGLQIGLHILYQNK